MIVKHLLAALVAGLIAGFLVTGAQQVKVVPLIVQAEKYEQAPAHDHEAAAEQPNLFRAAFALATPALAHGEQTGPHDHPDAAPAGEGEEESGLLFGVSRITGTLLANLVTGCGFALLLAAASLITGRSVTLGNGVLWGSAGWLVFQLLPSIGLPPELPGFPAADLGARQSWWFATAIASSAGLYGLVLRREAWAKIVGMLLLAAPHLIGAPQPPTLESGVPALLAAEYAVAALATGLFFWVILGLALGAINDRFVETER